jgi:hypothetical protein
MYPITPIVYDAPIAMPAAENAAILAYDGSDLCRGSAQRREQTGQSDEAQCFNFALHMQKNAGRDQLEADIRAKYREVYDASLQAFLPVLLNMSCAGKNQAALGLRPGYCGSMFLENYLDVPVEQSLAALVKQPIDRSSLVEIGNLVSRCKGGSQLLFVVLAATLYEAGYRWMVFTATPQVKKLIERLQFSPLELASANPEVLGEQASVWGSYYRTRPKVMVANLEQAMAAGRSSGVLHKTLEYYQPVVTRLAQCLRDHRRMGACLR